MFNGPTVHDFFKQFPDDDACLDYLMHLRHGEVIECTKCRKTGKFHRIKRHPAYECAWCGQEIYPMVGTMFHRSHTPLQKWFYAMYLFTTTRHGVPAKELQRQLGVTYKTAWRMAHELRKLMARADDDGPLSGHVEIDETYIGGRKPKIKGYTGRGAKGKTIVFGMLERDGSVRAGPVPNASGKILAPIIMKNVQRGSVVSSDEWGAYYSLAKWGYTHGKVQHRAKQYVNGIHHVNSLEGYWSQIKRGIRGTHVHVSSKHLWKYVSEFSYRYNMRKTPEDMFSDLIYSLALPRLADD